MANTKLINDLATMLEQHTAAEIISALSDACYSCRQGVATAKERKLWDNAGKQLLDAVYKVRAAERHSDVIVKDAVDIEAEDIAAAAAVERSGRGS